MASSQHPTNSAPSAAESAASPQPQDTRIIEQRIADFVAAWNKHDPAQMASAWHYDGDLIDPFGRTAKGRNQVQDLFRNEQSGPMKTSHHEMAITSIRQLSSDVVLVDADCTLTGMRSPDGKELPAFKPHVFFVVTRKDRDWRILAARPYAFAPRPDSTT